MSELTPEKSYSAEQLKDAVETENVKLPKVDIKDDYERSKEFSNSSEESSSNNFDSINRTGFSSSQSETVGEGSPENFKDMAQEITSHVNDTDE